jgi:hypothetical protein
MKFGKFATMSVLSAAVLTNLATSVAEAHRTSTAAGPNDPVCPGVIHSIVTMNGKIDPATGKDEQYDVYSAPGHHFGVECDLAQEVDKFRDASIEQRSERLSWALANPQSNGGHKNVFELSLLQAYLGESCVDRPDVKKFVADNLDKIALVVGAPNAGSRTPDQQADDRKDGLNFLRYHRCID